MTFGARNVTVSFGSVTALQDVSLDVPAGAVTAVVGGDGAGKSTLLRCLVGLIVPRHGSVDRPAKQHVGYMCSSSGTWHDLTVDENVAFVAGAYGAMPRRDLLERAGLAGVGGRLAGQLSGGMRQKLGFVLAMQHNPDLVVLDEPSTGVDPVSRVELWRMIAGAAAGGTAVVMSTTYLDEAERASSLLVLDAGRAVLAGRPDEVAAQTPGRVVEVDKPSDPARAWRRGRMFHEWLPDETPAGTPDLEDAIIVEMLSLMSDACGANLDATAVLARADGVTKTFGSFTAVADASLEVRAGEIVGLLGANGAGKTTLLRMLLGLLRPTRGSVEVFGTAPSRHERRRLGYVPQGLGLYTDLTVTENVRFSAEAFGVDDIALPDALRAISGRLVGEIGLGRQRQLAFACALGHRPELLVLDEPTSGVDALARARLWDTIHDQAESGVGVLVTTHYMQEAQQCDRLVIMAQGRVVATGSVADIVGDAKAVEVRTDDWAGAFTALDGAGLLVTLNGRRVRVAETSAAVVRRALSGIEASVDEVPATLEETMLAISRVA